MVADWIPMSKATPDKEEVFEICALTDLDQAHAFLALFRFWSWFDSESDNGRILSARPWTKLGLLSKHCPLLTMQFLEALVTVGWLRVTDEFIEVVNFDTWMGNSSKRRLRDARRKRIERKGSNTLSDMSNECPLEVGQKAEKKADYRTEQKSIKTPPSPPGGEGSGLRENEDAEASEPKPPRQPEIIPASNVRTLPADNPHLSPTAKRLAKLYETRVTFAFGKGAYTAIVREMALGATEADIEAAIRNYAAFCDRQGIEKGKRKSGAKFFGEELWREYVTVEKDLFALPSGQKAQPTPEEIARFEDERLKRLIEESRAKKASGTDQNHKPP